MRAFLPSLLASVLLLANCGAQIDTGRNNKPDQWPSESSDQKNKKADSQEPTSNAGNTNAGPGNGKATPNSSGSTGTPTTRAKTPGNSAPSGASCFDLTTSTPQSGVQAFCDNTLKPNPILNNIYDHLCTQGHLIAVLDQSGCAYNGSSGNVMSYIHVYFREPETSGKDYEDIHATISNPPIPASKARGIIQLAFEDYAAFKAQGKKWVGGTVEQVNLNHSSVDSGLDYHYLVDQGQYQLGYNAHIQTYQINDRLWAHVNYATGNFKLLTKFAQITMFEQLPNGTTLMMKIEDKTIGLENPSLYRRAMSGSNDLMKEFFVTMWKNMTGGAQ